MGKKLILPGDPQFDETIGSLSLNQTPAADGNRFGARLLSGRKYKICQSPEEARLSTKPAVYFSHDGSIGILSRDYGRVFVTLESNCNFGYYYKEGLVEKNENGKVSSMCDPYGADTSQWRDSGFCELSEWFESKIRSILG